MKFQPKDIVRIKGGKDVWEFRLDDKGGLAHLRDAAGYWIMTKLENLELVRRPGPVVFECEWKAEEFAQEVRLIVPDTEPGQLEQFVGRLTRVTVEILEESK